MLQVVLGDLVSDVDIAFPSLQLLKEVRGGTFRCEEPAAATATLFRIPRGQLLLQLVMLQTMHHRRLGLLNRICSPFIVKQL